MLALDALDIKVYAKGIDNVEIQGDIPLKLTLSTIGQTWGCLPFHEYVCSSEFTPILSGQSKMFK